MTSGALAGRRVLVARTRERATGLVDALHERGAEAVVIPLIATQPLASPDEITAAVAALTASASPRWAVFTSATAARLVLGAAGPDALRAVHLAAVGAETAAALDSYGLHADIAGPRDAEALATELLAGGVSGAAIWFPAAEGAGPALPERLRAAGAVVTVHHVYRTVMPDDAPRRLAVALDRGIDAVMLTSGSTARNLVRALEHLPLPPTTAVVCIGAQTAREARAAGLQVAAVASEPNVAGLIVALESLG